MSKLKFPELKHEEKNERKKEKSLRYVLLVCQKIMRENWDTDIFEEMLAENLEN